MSATWQPQSRKGYKVEWPMRDDVQRTSSCQQVFHRCEELDVEPAQFPPRQQLPSRGRIACHWLEQVRVERNSVDLQLLGCDGEEDDLWWWEQQLAQALVSWWDMFQEMGATRNHTDGVILKQERVGREHGMRVIERHRMLGQVCCQLRVSAGKQVEQGARSGALDIAERGCGVAVMQAGQHHRFVDLLDCAKQPDLERLALGGGPKLLDTIDGGPQRVQRRVTMALLKQQHAKTM